MTMTVPGENAVAEDREPERRRERWGHALHAAFGADAQFVEAAVQDHRSNTIGAPPYLCVYMTARAGTLGDDSAALTLSIDAPTPAELLKLLAPLVERLEAMVEADLDGLA